jgi:parallel beta-helix repeat protein
MAATSSVIRKLRHRFGLMDMVVLTSPFVLATLYLIVASAAAYHRSSQYDDYWSRGFSVRGEFRSRLRQLFTLPQTLSVKKGLSPELPDAGLLNLQVEKNLLHLAWSDPEKGGGDWVNAAVALPNQQILTARIRRRGDNSVHWLSGKRSLSVRTSRSAFFQRFRQFGLSAKDVYTSYVANRLAGEFGLMAPATTIVPVYLNNQFDGMYRFVEVVDSSFVIPYHRMPGNIYRGDAAERGDSYKGVPRDLLANPYIWEREALNERRTGPGDRQLRELIEDINGGDSAHQRMMSRVDRAEVSRLLAYLLMVGDPYHMDAVHNQIWYEDPVTGLMHPIPWDIRLLRLDRPQRQRVNVFFRETLRDASVVDGILRELSSRFNDTAWMARRDSLVGDPARRYANELRFEALRAGLIPPVGNAAESRRILQANDSVLHRWLADARVAFAAGPLVAGMRLLDFETRGLAGADLIGITVAGSGGGSLRMDANDNGVLDSSDPLVEGRWDGNRFVPSAPLPLVGGWDASEPVIQPGTQHYRVFLLGSHGTGSVTPDLVNRYTRVPLAVEELAPGTAIHQRRLFGLWRESRAGSGIRRFSGQVNLTADLELTAADTLVIEPGTTLRLGADVSILSRGPIQARGTEERPIRIIAAAPGQAFGVIGLVGPGADSSEFRWVTFERGGHALKGSVEFSATLNLHEVRGVTLDHVTVGSSGGAAIRAANAQVVLSNSTIAQSTGDGLVVDYSDVIVDSNSFEQIQGTAVDLTGSSGEVRQNRILGPGLKGIVVGELSDPRITHNQIQGTWNGIVVTDRSRPFVANNSLTSNHVAIVESRENWRYQAGGWATLGVNTLSDNGDSVRVDDFSRLTVAAGNPLPAGTPLVRGRFTDDFASLTDGWTATGGVTRLTKLDNSLLAASEARPGAFGTKVDWDFSRPASLVLEVSTFNVDSAVVIAVSDEGNVTQAIPLSNNPARFLQLRMALPPRRYRSLIISMVPHPRVEKLVGIAGWTELKPGQIWLRGYDVFPETPTDTSALVPGS